MVVGWYLAILAAVFVNCDGARLNGGEEQIHLPFVPKPPLGAPVDPEVFMNISELITSKGYPCENRKVQTEDGYILGIQRIPHGKNQSPNTVPKPVVLLQHGLLSSATSFIENLSNESLATVLADAGMDVWLGNSRGNTYSRKHVRLDPDQDAFWEWSWDEMAKYDLPATVDYILNVTGQSQIYYVGHSQGGEIAFGGFSENQELASKIKMFIALAPAVFLGNMKSPLRLLAPLSGSIEFLWELFGHGQFFEKTFLSDLLATQLCDEGVGNFLCENVLFLIGGYDFAQTNASRIPVYLSHHPAGTSVRNMMHYVQAVQSRKYQKFDFGNAEENRRHYNQTTPPEYDLTQMKVPTALFAASNDWLSDPRDISQLAPKIPNIIVNRMIQGWSHVDFVLAMDAPTVLYRDIIGLINQAEVRHR